jgi:hypothetical protein
MRTTLNLDEDALELIREYAETRSLAMGKAASELLRKAAASRTPTRLVNGFVVFDTSASDHVITSEHVKELESELE